MVKKEFIPTIEQNEIFNFLKNEKGNGLIDAVAGSGKTSTIIEGINYINNNESILFCAFNKKIQLEIKNRVSKYNRNINVKTTYALGLEILKTNNDIYKKHNIDANKYSFLLNHYLSENNNSDISVDIIKPNFERLKEIHVKKNKINSDSEKENIDDELIPFEKKAYNIFSKSFSLYRLTLKYFSGKNGFIDIINFYNLDIDIDNSEELNLFFEIIDNIIKVGINKALKEGYIDYADMLFLPEVFNYQSRYKYDNIFIDECQDLSNSQLKIVTKFGKNSRFFAVGDPFQSIYGFAGASPNSFNNVKLTFTPKTFSLTNCFRCSISVVDLAKEIRSDISTTNKEQGYITIIDYHELFNLAKNKDFVLSRYNSDLALTFFKMISLNIKCKIIGKEDIIEEIKDFVPKKFHFNKSFYSDLPIKIEKIFDKLSNKHKNDENKINEFEGIKNVILIGYSKFSNTQNFHDLVNELNMLFSSESDDCIILSSIHRSKGLESKNVFILNFEDLPIKPKDPKSEWEFYQEKCLKYVAITRAEVNLYKVKKSKIDIKDLLENKNNLDDFDNETNYDFINDLPL